jgi:DivIVA domain-containing protein
MGVDQTSLDRIRNATFPASRRGYDKQEVEKFLSRLADWLETGAGDESRSDTVKRELERVGERTGAILSQAEESAQQIRSEAEQEARETIDGANTQAEQTRQEADAYSEETRGAADTYAEQTRATVDQEAEESRAKVEQEAREAIADAQAQAQRIIDEGTRRRDDVEAVIADLVRRRDEVLVDTEELSAKLTMAVTEHRPAKGADPFDKPDELDPEQREVDDVASDGDEGPFDAEELEDEADEEPEPDEDEQAAEEVKAKTEKAPAKGGRRRKRVRS